MRFKGRSALRFVALGLLCLWFGGCGSEPAKPTTTMGTISGVAVVGAPLIGTVTIKDSNGTGIERTVPIAADGRYTINLYGLTPPFALRADGLAGGREYHLYSAATSADINGTVNITPFTDLIVANVAGASAAGYYNGSGFSTLTPAALAAAQSALQAKLQPILSAAGLPGSVDLLRTPISADHTGFDAVIDVVKVAVDPAAATATITNVVNHQSVTNKLATRTYSDTFTASADVTQAVAEIRALTGQIKRYSDLFATGLPAPADPQLLALFDPETFLDKGRDLNAFLSEITGRKNLIGTTFTHLVVDTIDPAAGTALVRITPLHKGGRIGRDNPQRYVKKSGVWLSQGDGWIAQADISAEAAYYPNGSPLFKTGLYFEIRADQPGNANVFSMVITGPGLPASGHTIDWWNFGGDYLRFDTDAQIAAIPDNASYTIKLYDGGNIHLATYTQTLPKRPLMLGELSAASFPTFTEQTLAALTTFAGGDLQVSWTLPEGLYPDQVWLRLSDGTYSNDAVSGKTVDGADLTTTLTLQPITGTGATFTPAYRYLNIYARDGYGRWFDAYL